MKTSRTLLLMVVALAVTGAAHAAIILSNFNNGDLTGTFSNTWSGSLVQNGTYATIGSPATDFGDYRSLNFTAVDITGLDQVTITAKLDSGNTATGFTVNLISGSGTAVASAYFDASLFSSSGFTTVSTSWVDGGSFTQSNLRAWQIIGGAPLGSTVGINFRMSFDSLSVSAVPEPAAYAAFFSVAVLGLAFWNKRRKAA